MLFSCCKGETHTHRSGLKALYRRLRALYRTDKLDSEDDLCADVLLGPCGTAPAVLVFGCPTQPFTARQFDELRLFLRRGGGLLVLLSEGGGGEGGGTAAAGRGMSATTNINYLLEELGVAANADAVVRTSQHKYLHPKEALITDGLVNRALLLHGSGCGVRADQEQQPHGGAAALGDAHTGAEGGLEPTKGLSLVYVHGCTLSVQPPAVPVLSSGHISFPMRRPLGAGRALLAPSLPPAASKAAHGRHRHCFLCCAVLRSGVLGFSRAGRWPRHGCRFCRDAVRCIPGQGGQQQTG